MNLVFVLPYYGWAVLASLEMPPHEKVRGNECQTWSTKVKSIQFSSENSISWKNNDNTDEEIFREWICFYKNTKTINEEVNSCIKNHVISHPPLQQNWYESADWMDLNEWSMVVVEVSSFFFFFFFKNQRFCACIGGKHWKLNLTNQGQCLCFWIFFLHKELVALWSKCFWSL